MTQSDFLRSIRQYFWQQNFTEVEIPYLNSSLPLEANIYAFETTWQHKNSKYYLPTSPEFALKKFISQNPVNCFAISHCFRDLEDSNSLHTPEFLMLEWYEINQNLTSLKESVKKFIHQLLDIEFSEFSLPSPLPQNEPDFNQFFLNKIEPKLPKDKAVFVTGYPSFLSPLALPDQRFELYINGIEIANGCTENTNSESIKIAFEVEKKYRQDNHLPLHPYSTDFINFSSSLPTTSGIGLGLDRLLQIINATR